MVSVLAELLRVELLRVRSFEMVLRSMTHDIAHGRGIRTLGTELWGRNVPSAFSLDKQDSPACQPELTSASFFIRLVVSS